METKQQIRKSHLQKRNGLAKEDCEKYSAAICAHLRNLFLEMDSWRKDGVFGYYPHGSEVSLLELYNWLLGREACLAFPRVSGDTMDFYQTASMEEFCKGAFGILEPNAGSKKVKAKRGVCLVPGSVFDREGNRYGYGKGYYDRYLSVHKGLFCIGIAYESQVEPWIITERCDVKMDALVTERAVSFFREREEKNGINRNL